MTTARSGSLALMHFRLPTHVAHTLRVHEKLKGYWDLDEAAWVVAEDDQVPAQLDHVEDEPASLPELVAEPAD